MEYFLWSNFKKVDIQIQNLRFRNVIRNFGNRMWIPRTFFALVANKLIQPDWTFIQSLSITEQITIHNDIENVVFINRHSMDDIRILFSDLVDS